MRQVNALTRKAITALLVNPEQHKPIAANTAAKKNKPMYDPAIPPLSRLPSADKDLMV